ncbi:MAG: hypothetical protein IAE79_02165 [Anaerolinea sp.]|nr:hypothetical protein [Anaerolinea sp.]
MKQNASMDASFWINVCVSNIAHFVSNYFQLFTPIIVAQEIRYPLDKLGIKAHTAMLFNEWVQAGKITLQEPATVVDWFQAGENAAIALTREQNYSHTTEKIRASRNIFCLPSGTSYYGLRTG